MVIGAYYFANFRKAGFPDLGPIPVRIKILDQAGMAQDETLKFTHQVTVDLDYTFRDGERSSPIDGTTSIILPEIDRLPHALNIPVVNRSARTVKALFNISTGRSG